MTRKSTEIVLYYIPLEGGRCSAAVLPLPPQASGLALLLARHLRFPSTWVEWEKLEYAARYSPGR